MKVWIPILITVIILIVIIYFSKSSFNNLEQKLYNGDKWAAYRLGDVYLQGDNNELPQEITENGKIVRVYGLGYHLTSYPDSIAAKLLQVNGYRRKNKELLMDIINSMPKNFPKVKDNELVLHIRTGDVMCKENKRFIWYSKLGDNAFWNKVLGYISSKGISKVYIVSGSHSTDCLKESADYLEDRAKFLRNSKVSIEYRLGMSPDDDFMFCLSAKNFISTGGGFGRMIYEINNNWF